MPKKTKTSQKTEKAKTKRIIKKKVVRYFEAIGRRKTSIARVRLFNQKEEKIIINQKPFEEYFFTVELQQIVVAPLERMKYENQFMISVRVKGGGIHSQSEAVQLGIARALLVFNPDFRKKLKKAGFLTRDPRMRERKKFGLKRARKAPQWQKR